MPSVLITGTSTGIGNDAALHLARNGYTVFATMRTPSANTNLEEAAKKESLDLHVLQQDVTDPASNQAAVDAVTKAAGQIDILVNNAGIGYADSIEETPQQKLRDVFETNFFGAMDLIQKVVPQMRERRAGTIVNVTSVAGVVSVSPQFAYSTSKVALQAATQILAQEMRPFGVRVCTINPGVVITPIIEKFNVPDSNTPYMQQWERMGLFFEAGVKAGTMPEVVSSRIRAVIEGNEYQLRNLAGPDAEGIVHLREIHNDEEWISLMGEPLPLDEWRAMASEISGIDL